MLFSTNKLYEDKVFRVKKGDQLFLLNVDTDMLYGVFKAKSDGKIDIVREAWLSAAILSLDIIMTRHPLLSPVRRVKLANPLKTKAIAEARIKTDTLDARTLAHLLRSDLVAECYIAPKEIREDRSLLRLRTNLVQDRTRVMNRVHSLLDKYDVKCDYDNIFGVKGTRWLSSLKLSDNDQILLHEYIMQIEFLNTEIKNTESKISYQASKNESAKILMSMTGIDYFSAMLIALEIGNITRFSTPEKLVSWSGLCPSIHQSGNSLLGKDERWKQEGLDGY